jgi:hypothetical protein
MPEPGTEIPMTSFSKKGLAAAIHDDGRLFSHDLSPVVLPLLSRKIGTRCGLFAPLALIGMGVGKRHHVAGEPLQTRIHQAV